jgi:cytochrome c oxidase subunit 1
MALTGGIYYWFPKFSGRMYNEGLGKLHFWMMFIGQNLTFFPMHFTGMDGMPRRIYTYASGMGWDFWNIISTVGAYVIAASILVFIYNVVMSWRKGEKATSDPWDARTLEWSIPSPPPEYNFAEIPVVHDRDEWWAQKRREVRPHGVPVAGGSGEEERHSIHMPQPSYWPLIVSIGLLIGGYGLLYNLAVAAIGGAIAMVAVYAWSFEPVNEPSEGHAVEDHH